MLLTLAGAITVKVEGFQNYGIHFLEASGYMLFLGPVLVKSENTFDPSGIWGLSRSGFLLTGFLKLLFRTILSFNCVYF